MQLCMAFILLGNEFNKNLLTWITVASLNRGKGSPPVIVPFLTCFVCVCTFCHPEPMPSAPSLPPQRRTWMTTSPLIARPPPLAPRQSTPRTTASSRSTPARPRPHPSTTRRRRAAPRSPPTEASTTSRAATPRILCCSPSRPPRRRPTRTAVTAPLSSTPSTLLRGRPPWRRSSATSPSAMTSRRRLVGPIPPTRCPARRRRPLAWLALMEGETLSRLLDHLNLCSALRRGSCHPRRPSAHLQTPTACPARPQKQTGTTACPLAPGIKLYAATPSGPWTLRASEKVCFREIRSLLLSWRD